VAAAGSKRVVLIAIGVNGLIAVAKFIVATITGSSAMLSEGIHSVVDTGNQSLLLFGMYRAKRPPDERHPFGYGMEIYFWAFVVAIVLFSMGAGLSIYEGISHLQHPVPIESPIWNYFVLVLAMGLEGYALYAAWTEFDKSRGKTSLIRALRHSKDPSVFTVLLEDSAAILGLLIALGGISLSIYLDAPAIDAWASILIGVMLGIIAVFLAVESKQLLVGEAADPAVVSGIRAIVQKDKRISHVNELLTMHLGPDDLLLNLSVDFKNHYTAVEVEQAISEIERRIKKEYPQVRKLFIEAQSISGHLADRLEQKEEA